MIDHAKKAEIPQISDDSRVSTRRIWTTAWIVTSVFMLSNSATPLYVQWQTALGFTNGTLTLIFAAYIAGLLGSLLAAGQLSDRLGRKAVLYPGLLAAVAACALFALADSVGMLLAARLLTGIAVGVIVSMRHGGGRGFRWTRQETAGIPCRFRGHGPRSRTWAAAGRNDGPISCAPRRAADIPLNLSFWQRPLWWQPVFPPGGILRTKSGSCASRRFLSITVCT